jgi:F-type H+-transporting ATPase subunit epsilon
VSPLPLRVVTPEKLAWEGEVDALTVPAWEGSLGILPGHAPLLAQLKEGVIRMRNGGEERFLAGRASLFAETAEMAGDVDLERARQAAERARQALRAASSEADDERAAAALRRALARLRAADLWRAAGRSRRTS